MEKRLKDYLKIMDALLEHSQGTSPDGTESSEYHKLNQQHLVQISFFQHERLIHLIVTCLFAVLTFAVFITMLFLFTVGLLVLFIALMALLIPYIRHYYILENGVQKLYRQYDRLCVLSGMSDIWTEQ